MLDIFHYSFMVRAFIAGMIIAVIAPFIGVFLVSRKYALIADSLAHVSLAGIALGFLMGIHPIITALIVAIGAAIFIERKPFVVLFPLPIKISASLSLLLRISLTLL